MKTLLMPHTYLTQDFLANLEYVCQGEGVVRTEVYADFLYILNVKEITNKPIK